MGKQKKLKQERREARERAGRDKLRPHEKVGDLDDLTDDTEKLLRRLHNQVKHRLKTASMKAGGVEFTDKEQKKLVQSGESCSKCTAPKGCCRLAVSIVLVEGLPIARRLIDTDRDTPEFRKRLHTLGDAMEGMTQEEWFDTQTPCVFLDDERCSIYSVRPSACRHHVVFSEPKSCQYVEGELPARTLQFDTAQELATSATWSNMVANSFFGLDPIGTGVMYAGSLPKVVVRILDALDHEDYRVGLRDQNWSTINNPLRMG